MRRKDRSALSMPAAVQLSTVCPSRQRVTLRFVVRAVGIIDSIGLGVVNVLARGPSMPREGEHLLQPLEQAGQVHPINSDLQSCDTVSGGHRRGASPFAVRSH
jgi:hypothetical protein